MISVKSQKQLHWRNQYSQQPVFAVELDLCDSATIPASTFRPVCEAVFRTIPGAAPPPQDAGALDAIAWMAATFQGYYDVAPPGCERVGDPASGSVVLYTAWRDAVFAHAPIRAAVDLANLAIATRAEPLRASVGQVSAILSRCQMASLGQSSRELARVVERRRIPWIRTAGGRVLAGHGARQQMFQDNLLNAERLISVLLSQDKWTSLSQLHRAGIPVGRVGVAATVDRAEAEAELIGYPLALKPVQGTHGKGVSPRVKDATELRRAAAPFQAEGAPMLLQSHFPGDDHRLLVVEGRFIAAARRVPPVVTGDGVSTVQALVRRLNGDPNRGREFQRLMCRVEIDEATVALLADQGLTAEDVPDEGRQVQLKLTANIHTGGTAVDVTDSIHPDNIRLAERAARKIGLRVAGVDYMTTDITRSWRETGGGVTEVNRGPGLRPHWIADPARDVVSPIVEVMFPDGETGRIPTAMVTGTNGKTTTCMMLARILKTAGHTPGVATTDGVIIDDDWVVKRDVAGAGGADCVLTDPDVTAAVLETARGGILKDGIYLARCDVAALLNIRREQIDMDGVETVEEMARLKRRVTDAAAKAVILNLDDPLTAALVAEYPAERVIGFSMLDESPAATALLARGGAAVVLRQGAAGEEIVLLAPGADGPVLPVAEIPLTMAGRHRGNVANALAATGLAHGMGIGEAEIMAGLRACAMTRPGEPGRMIFLPGWPFEALVDYAANPSSLEAVVSALGDRPPTRRRICVICAPGNRPGWWFDEHGAAAARGFDRFICFEQPHFQRGRPQGDIASAVQRGLVAAGVSPDRVTVALELDDALRIARDDLRPGDLLAILGGETTYLLGGFRRVFGPARAARSAAS